MELKVLQRHKSNEVTTEDAIFQKHRNVQINIMPSRAEIHLPLPNWMNSIPFSLFFPGSSCDFAHVQNNNRQEGVAAE